MAAPSADYVCPNCESTDNLEVAAKVWVRLDQKNDDIETEQSTHDGSHEWDGNSAAVCTACRWTGWVDDLAKAAQNDGSGS